MAGIIAFGLGEESSSVTIENVYGAVKTKVEKTHLFAKIKSSPLRARIEK